MRMIPSQRRWRTYACARAAKAPHQAVVQRVRLAHNRMQTRRHHQMNHLILANRCRQTLAGNAQYRQILGMHVQHRRLPRSCIHRIVAHHLYLSSRFTVTTVRPSPRNAEQVRPRRPIRPCKRNQEGQQRLWVLRWMRMVKWHKTQWLVGMAQALVPHRWAPEEPQQERRHRPPTSRQERRGLLVHQLDSIARVASRFCSMSRHCTITKHRCQRNLALPLATSSLSHTLSLTGGGKVNYWTKHVACQAQIPSQATL